MIHNHNLDFGDVTIVADDEKIKAHKFLMRFAANFFSRYISETKKDQYIYIHHILNLELGDVTIVTDDEQIKAHKYVVRFATFFDTFLKQKKITNIFSS